MLLSADGLLCKLPSWSDSEGGLPCIAKAERMELHPSAACRDTQWLTSKCDYKYVTLSVHHQLNNRPSAQIGGVKTQNTHKTKCSKRTTYIEVTKRHLNTKQSSYLGHSMLTAHWALRQDYLERLYNRIIYSLYSLYCFPVFPQQKPWWVRWVVLLSY